MHDIDEGDRITMVYDAAGRLAAEVRKLMREHNDFGLAEDIIEQIAIELRVPVVVGDVDHARNVRVLGDAFVRATDQASRLEINRIDVTEVVGDVLVDLREQLALLDSDSARPGTSVQLDQRRPPRRHSVTGRTDPEDVHLIEVHPAAVAQLEQGASDLLDLLMPLRLIAAFIKPALVGVEDNRVAHLEWRHRPRVPRAGH